MTGGLYLYAIAQGDREEDFKLGGIGQGPVRAFTHRGWVAVVEDCEPKTVEIQDQKVLADWLLIHQRIVDLAWQNYGNIVPLSFGRIVKPTEGKSARENLNEWLEKESEELKRKLGRLRNKAEYGVQVLWDPTSYLSELRVSDAEVLEVTKAIHSRPEGVSYLLDRKLEEITRQRLGAEAEEYFTKFYHRIRKCVEETRVEKLRKEEPPRQMILNVSCLQEKGNAVLLGEELEEIGKMDGFDVRFTGPWPPYSFV